MQEQMRARLAELQLQYQTGQAQLQELVRQEAALRETMLRISGAIQVLEEMLDQGPSTTNGQAATSKTMRVA
jgi:hypothetical protein